MNETSEKMKELGKFAKVKMPEYDEKVRLFVVGNIKDGSITSGFSSSVSLGYILLYIPHLFFFVFEQDNEEHVQNRINVLIKVHASLEIGDQSLIMGGAAVGGWGGGGVGR